MVNYFLSIDVQLTNLLNNFLPHNLFFDIFFSIFSLSVSSLPIWFVIVTLLYIVERKINKKFVFNLLIALAISSIIVFGLKLFIGRPRPEVSYPSLITQNIINNHMRCDTDGSFPSGHATIAFTCATSLAIFDKKRKWFYYLIAVLISLSRIYLDCHYLLDVIGGGLIGYFIGIFCLRLKKIRFKV
jgi:undecaprenyl-diphosphatase